MLEPWHFGFTRFHAIEHFTDLIDYKIVSGYAYGRKQYFRTKPLYKLFDSFATVTVDKETLPSPPLELWGEMPENHAHGAFKLVPSSVTHSTPKRHRKQSESN